MLTEHDVTRALDEVAQMKRFHERWIMDGALRERLAAAPAEASARGGLSVSLEELRAFRYTPDAPEALLAPPEPAATPLPPRVQRFQAFQQEKHARATLLRSRCTPRDPRMAAWRERQIARCTAELGTSKNALLMHTLVAFELTRGCSAGCWFCAIGARPLSGIAPYDEPTRALWRGMLEVIHEVLGDGARHGFCYWATDPLDNPDYERFSLDFAELLGTFPQTTTALMLKDPRRTRALLALSARHGCEGNRFSILSLKQLERVHAEFSPGELLHVDLIPMNRESGMEKVNAGHARTRALPGHRIAPEAFASTIACVSGFLFNLVERTVRLVTPCNASKRWPLGYWVLAEARFSEPGELRQILREMIDRRMKTHLTLEDPFTLRPGVSWSRDERGHSLKTPWLISRLPGGAMLDELEPLVSSGRLSAGELADALWERRHVPLANTLFLLNQLFLTGLFEQEPEPRPAPPPVSREGRT